MPGPSRCGPSPGTKVAIATSSGPHEWACAHATPPEAVAVAPMTPRINLGKSRIIYRIENVETSDRKRGDARVRIESDRDGATRAVHQLISREPPPSTLVDHGKTLSRAAR